MKELIEKYIDKFALLRVKGFISYSQITTEWTSVINYI